ncbi:hypothetical protein [Methanocalculus sp.]|uniref:hypothetical protein n=1 Tax=Methanocalculus sp. TaxID=2004547 RepID=UPI00182DDB1B|nr:hypothetical protein [Methanocalculus sp.]HIJ05957.1 hypothetical protein [Methanocalculus sp.]
MFPKIQTATPALGLPYACPSMKMLSPFAVEWSYSVPEAMAGTVMHRIATSTSIVAIAPLFPLFSPISSPPAI